MHLKQHTIKSSVSAIGLGLHSGKRVSLTLQPAKINVGIVFRRVDLEVPVEIIASATAVSDTFLSSTIANGSVKVHTVEHLMSACYGLGIDNLYVDIDGEEIPIFDGSSSSFVFLLQSAGIKQQNALRRFARVTKILEVCEGDGDNLKWARFEPYAGFKLDFEINFSHPAILRANQRVEFDFDNGSYEREIANARTFGFIQEFEKLNSCGLALGAGLDNVVVMDDYRVLNSDGLRCKDEFVKHKILDAIGDLYLFGCPLLVSYRAFRAGHALNNQLLCALVKEPESWEEITFSHVNQMQKFSMI